MTLLIFLAILTANGLAIREARRYSRAHQLDIVRDLARLAADQRAARIAQHQPTTTIRPAGIVRN